MPHMTEGSRFWHYVVETTGNGSRAGAVDPYDGTSDIYADISERMMPTATMVT